MITGTLGYSLRREFLANAIALREVETYNYEIYSVDFAGLSANTIQTQIKNQFSQIYSGDINVTLFNSQNDFSFPSDSIRAAKFGVTVEIRKPVQNLSGMFPELGSGWYSGLNSVFFSGYGSYLMDFRENFAFATNTNGNREFSHDIAFGLKTGWSGDSSTTGRKGYAQTIASGIFAQDQNTTLGIVTMAGQTSLIANPSNCRNYFTESYDLMKNTYSFGRKREWLPSSGTNATVNLSNAVNMNTDGTTEVSEKASFLGNVDYPSAKTNLETYLSGSYGRCSGIYSKLYTSGIIVQDLQYSGIWTGLLPLINTPLKTIKTYNSNELTAGYDVTYTNNPTFTGNSASITQTFEFEIDGYDLVNASHTFDIVASRIVNNSGYALTLMNAVTGNSPSVMAGYYSGYFPTAATEFPNFNLTRANVMWPNLQTKSSAKFSYSNNPTYFVTYNGVQFNVVDYTVSDKRPTDIVSEYKVVNRPTKKSVLSYGYQTEKGEITVNIKTVVGKNSNVFYPDGIGSFGNVGVNALPVSGYLPAIYQLGGQVFMSKFNYPTTALNWFISDSKVIVDSDCNINASLTYTYTLKKRSAQQFP